MSLWEQPDRDQDVRLPTLVAAQMNVNIVGSADGLVSQYSTSELGRAALTS